jgi:cell division protein FtsB
VESAVAEVRWGWVSIPVICFLLGAGAVLWSDERSGLGALVALRGQVEEARLRTERLAAEERRLSAEIQRLRSDEFSIEAAARSALGMVRPGEIVVRLDAAGEAR